MLKVTTNSTQKLQIRPAGHRDIHVRLFAFFIATAFLFGLGCTEDTAGEAGLEILPNDEQVSLQKLENVSFEMETRVQGNANTVDRTFQLMGNYIDPQFGRLSATTYTQIKPGPGLETLGDPNRLGLDSIVLTLSLFGAYGRPETPQEIRVFEVTEDFPEDDLLTADRELSLSSNNLVDPTDKDRILSFPDGPTNSNGAYGDIRVSLTPEIGNKILAASSDQLSSVDLFNDYIKGLAITTAPVSYLSREPGAIFQMFLGGSVSDVTLYYRRLSLIPRVVDTPSVETFLIDRDSVDRTVKFHTVKRSETEDKLLGISIADNSQLYHFLQAASLTEIFCRLPDLDQIEALGVNQAELILKVEEDFLGSETENETRRFLPPANLGMYILKEDGTEEDLFVPGIRDPLNILTPEYDQENMQYTFQMTTYIQQILTKRRANAGFVIRPLETVEVGTPAEIGSSEIRRVIVGGPDHPELTPEFNLIYTSTKP